MTHLQNILDSFEELMAPLEDQIGSRRVPEEAHGKHIAQIVAVFIKYAIHMPHVGRLDTWDGVEDALDRVELCDPATAMEAIRRTPSFFTGDEPPEFRQNLLDRAWKISDEAKDRGSYRLAVISAVYVVRQGTNDPKKRDPALTRLFELCAEEEIREDLELFKAVVATVQEHTEQDSTLWRWAARQTVQIERRETEQDEHSLQAFFLRSDRRRNAFGSFDLEEDEGVDQQSVRAEVSPAIGGSGYHQ